MKDVSLISYHLGGLALLLLLGLIPWAQGYLERFTYLVVVNTGTQYHPSTSTIITILLVTFELILIYLIRHKVGKDFMLGLSTAFVVVLSLLALIALVIITIASKFPPSL